LLVGWQDVAPSDDVEAADWIHGRLHPFAQDVGSVVPVGFGAYARIFHPATSAGRLEASGTIVPGVEVRWSDVAAGSGRTVHPEMQFHAIAAPTDDRAPGSEPVIYEPRLGVLSERQAGALVGLLSKHTATPNSCWLCLWDGYGYLHPGGSSAWFVAARPPFARLQVGFRRLQLRWSKRRTPRPDQPRVRLPGRDYLLFRGPVARAEGWEHGPNLWWPDDHAWCVASEIDFPYTYVGGPSELIEEIVKDPALEALPATVTHGITWTSDKINS
jgi:hypothetical protein